MSKNIFSTSYDTLTQMKSSSLKTMLLHGTHPEIIEEEIFHLSFEKEHTKYKPTFIEINEIPDPRTLNGEKDLLDVLETEEETTTFFCNNTPIKDSENPYTDFNVPD